MDKHKYKYEHKDNYRSRVLHNLLCLVLSFFAVSEIIIKTGKEATDSDIAAEICDGKGDIESLLKKFCAWNALCKKTT